MGIDQTILLSGLSFRARRCQDSRVWQHVLTQAKKIGPKDSETGAYPELIYLTRKLFPARKDLTVGQVASGNNPVHMVTVLPLAGTIVNFDLSASEGRTEYENSLMKVARSCFPQQAPMLRAALIDRTGYYEQTPIYTDLELVFMQDFGRLEWARKALADVEAQRGAVIIVEGEERMFQTYAELASSRRLTAEYFIFSQKGSLFCRVDETKYNAVFRLFNELNGSIAGRTRACLVLRNPL